MAADDDELSALGVQQRVEGGAAAITFGHVVLGALQTGIRERDSLV